MLFVLNGNDELVAQLIFINLKLSIETLGGAVHVVVEYYFHSSKMHVFARLGILCFEQLTEEMT